MLTLAMLLSGATSSESLDVLLTILGPVCVLYLIIYTLRKWWTENHPTNVLPFQSLDPQEEADHGEAATDQDHDSEIRLAA
jgi:hypothetical protein